MFLAEKADQEATKEANRLQDMQRAPSHSNDGMFDNRVGQRRVWMAKNEVALQVSTVHIPSPKPKDKLQKNLTPHISVSLPWSVLRFL